MTKSARDIFYSYPKLPVDAPMPMYVEVGEYETMATQADRNSDKVQEQKGYIATLKQEYEALKVKAGNMSQDKEHDIIQRDERIFELQTENDKLLGLLRQWLKVGEPMSIRHEWDNQLISLIFATKAVLGK